MRMMRWQRTGRALAVHAHGACLAVDGMRFERGQVVRHVVQHVQRRRGFLVEHPTGCLGQQLAVGASVVGRGGHRRQVGLALGGADGYTCQLAIRNFNAEAAHGISHLANVIGADLMTHAPWPCSCTIPLHAPACWPKCSLYAVSFSDIPQRVSGHATSTGVVRWISGW